LAGLPFQLQVRDVRENEGRGGTGWRKEGKGVRGDMGAAGWGFRFRTVGPERGFGPIKYSLPEREGFRRRREAVN